MSGIFFRCALLMGALILSQIAQAQQEPRPLGVDLAVDFTAERAKIAATDCGCFWMQGGSINGAVAAFRGLSVVASMTGERASEVAPGVDVNKIDFMAGPRYTLYTTRWTNRWLGSQRGTNVFGEALFGEAHGFSSLFPTPGGGSKSSANSLSMQFGGGLNLGLSKGFGIRALEVDYVRTTLPNGVGNLQNDLRLSIGVSYHFERGGAGSSARP